MLVLFCAVFAFAMEIVEAISTGSTIMFLEHREIKHRIVYRVRDVPKSLASLFDRSYNSQKDVVKTCMTHKKFICPSPAMLRGVC